MKKMVFTLNFDNCKKSFEFVCDYFCFLMKKYESMSFDVGCGLSFRGLFDVFKYKTTIFSWFAPFLGGRDYILTKNESGLFKKILEKYDYNKVNIFIGNRQDFLVKKDSRDLSLECYPGRLISEDEIEVFLNVYCKTQGIKYIKELIDYSDECDVGS
jgi:hypothetical protein